MKITIEENNGQIYVDLKLSGIKLFITFYQDGGYLHVKTISMRVNGKLKRIRKDMNPIEISDDLESYVKWAITAWIKEHYYQEVVEAVKEQLAQLENLAKDLDCEDMVGLVPVLIKELNESLEEDGIKETV